MGNKYISKTAIFYLILLAFLSIIPVPDLGFQKIKFFANDKLIHFIMYSFLIIGWGIRMKNYNDIKYKIMCFAIFFGLFLEILQHLLPFGRYFDWVDFIANSIGVLFGTFILYYLKKKLL